MFWMGLISGTALGIVLLLSLAWYIDRSDRTEFWTDSKWTDREDWR